MAFRWKLAALGLVIAGGLGGCQPKPVAAPVRTEAQALAIAKDILGSSSQDYEVKRVGGDWIVTPRPVPKSGADTFSLVIDAATGEAGAFQVVHIDEEL